MARFYAACGFLFYTLSMLSCEQPSTDAYITDYNSIHFSVLDIKGNSLSDEFFLNGASLILIMRSNYDYSNLFDILSEYENIFNTKLSILCISNINDMFPANCICINDSKFYELLYSFFKDNSLLMFRDRSLLFHVNPFSISKSNLLFKIHCLFNNYSSPREIIEYNRPDNFIDTKMIYQLISDHLSSDSLNFVFILDAIYSCHNTNIISYIEKTIFSNNSHAIIILSSKYNDHDIYLIRNNFKITIPIIKLPPAIISDYAKLCKNNLYMKFNIMFAYNGKGDCLNTEYIWNNCVFLNSYLNNVIVS